MVFWYGNTQCTLSLLQIKKEAAHRITPYNMSSWILMCFVFTVKQWIINIWFIWVVQWGIFVAVKWFFCFFFCSVLVQLAVDHLNKLDFLRAYACIRKGFRRKFVVESSWNSTLLLHWMNRVNPLSLSLSGYKVYEYRTDENWWD